MRTMLFFSLLLNVATTGFVDASASQIGPKIVGNGNGHFIVTWSAFNQANFVIQQATLIKGAEWSSPSTISAIGREAFYPEVTLNDSDQAMFIWSSPNGAFTDIFAASASFGGSASAPKQLSKSLGNCSIPKIGIDLDGNTVAAWQESSSSNYTVSAANYPPSANWSSPVDLLNKMCPFSFSNFPTAPDLAVFPSLGDTVAVWQKEHNGSLLVQGAVLYFAASSWTKAETLSLERATNPQIAYSDSGEALAVWQRINNSFFVFEVSSFTNGSWSPPVMISFTDAHLVNPQIAMNASGQAVLIGEKQVGTQASIIAVTRTAQGMWGNTQIISGEDSYATSSALAMNNSRQVIAVWENDDALGTIGTIRAAKLASGGTTWSAPVTLSPLMPPTQSNMAPVVIIDSTGYGIATWQARDNTQLLPIFFQVSILSSFAGAWSTAETISN